MGTVATYLNFMGRTAEAFEHYRSAFGTEYVAPPMTMGEAPMGDGAPPMSDEDRRAIMHIALPILGGHVLMGTDMLESLGHQLVEGTNVSIMLMPDTRAEADRLFAVLGEGGTDLTPPQDMFWGDYFGSCRDRFGIGWMFNVASTPGTTADARR